MAITGCVFRFGPFALDSGRRRLEREGDLRLLRPRQMDILLYMAAHPGRPLTKQELLEAAWPDTDVSDASIAQAISLVRKALAPEGHGEHYVQTIVGHGYRFVVPVTRDERGGASRAADWVLEPHRAFVNGRAALESFDRDQVERAYQWFTDALLVAPHLADVHIGLANACLLLFESTRADQAANRTRLLQAEHHVREGCRLNPSSGHAWSTYALVKHRLGDTEEAVAAARHAIALEPDEWLHHLQLAWVSWGGERLRAARHALSMCPTLAHGHWFAATVHIARGTLDRGLEDLRAGCALQDMQHAQVAPPETATHGSGRQRSPTPTRFPATGLHWLHGLVLAALGREEEAFEEFRRELAVENLQHIYGRECSANCWYAIGILHLRAGRHDAASAAFREALTRVPDHRLAAIAAAGPSIDTSVGLASGGGVVDGADAAMAFAASLAAQGKHEEAAQICGALLLRAEPGPTGWLLPVEPLLHATGRRDAWAATLAALAARAV